MGPLTSWNIINFKRKTCLLTVFHSSIIWVVDKWEVRTFSDQSPQGSWVTRTGQKGVFQSQNTTRSWLVSLISFVTSIVRISREISVSCYNHRHNILTLPTLCRSRLASLELEAVHFFIRCLHVFGLSGFQRFLALCYWPKHSIVACFWDLKL